MTAPVLAYQTPIARQRYFSILNLVALTLAGLVLPLPSLALGWLLCVVYTEKSIAYHAMTVYDQQTAFPLTLLTLLAMICFGRMLFATHRNQARPWVRVGVYLCPVINLVYLVPVAALVPSLILDSSGPDADFVWNIAASFSFYVLGPMGLLGAIAGLCRYRHVRRYFVGLIIVATMLIVLPVLGAAVMNASTPARGWEFMLWGIVMVPVFWPLAANVTLAIFVRRHPLEKSLTPSLAATRPSLAVTGALVAATGSSLVLHLMNYSTTGPGSSPIRCFVVSAAARGHRPNVRSCAVELPFGQVMINDQLRYLLAAEIALRLEHPRIHRRLRAVYNRVGPLLACCVCTRWLADVAYVGIKPLEMAARIYLRRHTEDVERVPRLLLAG